VQSSQRQNSRKVSSNTHNSSFIGARWVTGRSEHKVRPINPYRQDVIMEIPAADKRDLEDAYQEAQRAQVAWAEALPSERSLDPHSTPSTGTIDFLRK